VLAHRAVVKEIMLGDRPSKMAALSTIGVIAGMLLLVFAGISAIVATSTPAQAGTVEEMLPRSLQVLGYITTTQMPSSFDSSDSSSSGSSFEPSKSLESGSLRSSDARNVFLIIGKSVGSAWLTTTLTLLVQAVFAALYYRTVVQPEMDDSVTLAERDPFGGHGNNDFDNNICEFHKNPWVCLHGLCCPMVRTAHTNEAAGICGFWATIFCWCSCSWLTLGFGPCCLLVYWRMMLKSIMKIGDNIITDFCVTLMCPWLSVCQQANALDNAMGYRVTGCCEGTQMMGME
jgi:Cys-rich protein (TIGR01571 family)